MIIRHLKNALISPLILSSLVVALIVSAEIFGLCSTAQEEILSLEVNKNYGARALWGRLVVIPSIGGSLKFFDRSVAGNRKLFLSGPWEGNLKGELTAISEKNYEMAGSNKKHLADYRICFDQVSDTAIELTLKIRAPEKGRTLEFEIMKLLGDVFKGNQLTAAPEKRSDHREFPIVPAIDGERSNILLRKKDKINIKTRFFELEIEDLAAKKTINLADFRNVAYDKTKGFNLYAIVEDLNPGLDYTFKYQFRFRPASISNYSEPEDIEGKNSEIYQAAANPWLFFALSPKFENLKKEYFTIKPEQFIYGSSDNIAAEILRKELGDLLETEFEIKPLPSSPPGEGIVIDIDKPNSDNAVPLPDEGFEITITNKLIVVKGKDNRGCLYGVYTLLSRLNKDNNKWVIQAGTVRDWPDLSLRGICTIPVGSAIQDVNLFKNYISAFSKARANLIIFYHHPGQVLDWQAGTGGGWWRQESVEEIVDYARSLHMEVWAGFNHKFKASRFPDLKIAKGSDFYNPGSEHAYHQLFSLYEFLLKTYRPSTLLIGHDEIHGLSVYASGKEKSTADILAKDVEKIYLWLKTRGVETAMFGDMLLDHAKWRRLVGGAAHSGQPFRNSGDTADAIQMIPKQVKIIDWHYNEKPSYPSIGYFKDNGFEVLGCSWKNANAAKAMASSAKFYKGQGVVGSDWRFWQTLAPTATTLYSTLCGWSNSCDTSQKNRGAYALSGALKQTMNKAAFAQIPVDLGKACNEITYDSVSQDNRGVFNIGPMLDLRYLPFGEQLFGDILFNMPSPHQKLENNCVAVGYDQAGTSSPAQEVEINSGSVKTDALAFLHTSYLQEPKYTPRSIGSYTIKYEDGTSTKIDLKEGWNITDVRSSIGLRKYGPSVESSPDILLGAELVWRGQSDAGLPINIQMLIWENPFPKKKLVQIKLSANEPKSKDDLRIVLLALTNLKKASSGSGKN